MADTKGVDPAAVDQTKAACACADANESTRAFVRRALSGLAHLVIGVCVATAAFIFIFAVAVQLERGLHYCVAARWIEGGSLMYYSAFCVKYLLLASDLVAFGAFVWGFTRIAVKRFIK